MQNYNPQFRILRRTFLVITVIFLGVVVSSIFGPNQELHFIREVPSQMDLTRLDRNVSALARWPQWFYSTSEVSIQNQDSISSSNLQKGAQLTFKMNPNKGERKKFILTAEVLEYIPAHYLSLKILDDSSGRLTKLFDEIRWDIRFFPNNSGSLIRAEAIAHTRHWKSRLFGRISERILMNQIFYPNVLKLAELKQPFSLNQDSQNGLYAP